ncbi:PREDICTED: uncharacterized protein LOC100640600 isoform X1 [Amphimedon queenslandica]|nr:PREDICTED: uncharacterized protein LOC100640600 isoform X1 [Amphimedon queenslandica]|eukprot:XP_019862598.1 PREDICTED: uncharacterized protein LOC100640600 isoform X1 [Amphimedon queenslandica]
MHRGRTGYAAEIIKLPDGDHKGPVPIKKVLKKRSSKDSVSSDDDDNGNNGKLSPSLSPSKFKLQPKKIDLGSDASKSTEGTSKFTFSTPKSSVSTPNSSISGVYELPEGAPNNELLISIDKKLTQVLDYLRTGSLRIHSTSSSDSEISKQVVSPRISPFPDTKEDDLAILKMPKKTPESFALSLMDTLFTDEEMKTHLFIKKKKSRSNKEELDRERVRKLFAHVTTEFGQEAVKSKFSSIVEKCNQKCRDKGKSSVKKEDEESALVESIITNDDV